MIMRYKINPLVYLYYNPQEQGLTFVDPVTKRHFLLENDWFFEFIRFAKKERTLNELFYFLDKNKKHTQSLNRSILQDLIDQNVLVKAKGKDMVSKLNKVREEWADKGWLSAFYYHLYSRDYPFLDYSKRDHSVKDYKLMENYRKKWPPPSNYKDYPKNKLLKLTVDKKLLESLLFNPRHSKETYGILDQKSLSILLYLTFGQISSIEFPVLGEAIHKTSPSGAARHPSEAYLFLLKKNDLPAGVHHYSVRHHGLELLKTDINAEVIREIFFQLNHFPDFDPKAIIVITSLFEKSMWRYREPRSFRVIFFDIGHLIATARTVGEALGLGLVIGDGFEDRKVKKILGLKGYGEQPFNFIALI